MSLSLTTLTCYITIHRRPWPHQGFFFPSVLLGLVGHSEKSLCYLFLSIHTHTHVTLFCVSFPVLSLSSSPRYLTLRTYLLYFISRVTYMCAYYSITSLCKNCHFIHFVNTSFKGCTPFTTVFVLYFS